VAYNYGGGWGAGLEKLREQIETAKTN